MYAHDGKILVPTSREASTKPDIDRLRGLLHLLLPSTTCAYWAGARADSYRRFTIAWEYAVHMVSCVSLEGFMGLGTRIPT